MSGVDPQSGMILCKNCLHFTPINTDNRGSCDRWEIGYPRGNDHLASNEVLVEGDEGWGMSVGPDFGCVLAKRKSEVCAVPGLVTTPTA